MRRFIICAAAIGLAALPLVADTEIIGSYTWTYETSGGNAKILSVSPKPFGALTIPSSLGGNPVTSIGDSAFGECNSLTSVTIPNGVTSIGKSAFDRCFGLKSVTIPNSVTSIGDSAFRVCTSLTSVAIPNGVTHIGDSVFEFCSGLTSVTIPNSVTSIGIGAFLNCSGLTSVTIPNSVTSIGNAAFLNCNGLTSVTIPNSVTSIGNYAFSGCSGMSDGNGFIVVRNCLYGYTGAGESVMIPDSVTSIEDGAFYGCSGLTSVMIPDSVTYIGNSAFNGCTAMADVYCRTAPAALTWGDASGDFKSGKETKIHVLSAQLSAYESKFGSTVNATFVGEPNLPDVVGGFMWSYRIVGDGAEIYRDDGSGDGTTAVFPKPTGAVTIPSTLGGKPVTSIGCHALDECYGMTSATIPDSVTDIGEGAFRYCNGMTSVTIPDSVTSIGWGAFWSCGLTSVTIPHSVTSIEANAFYNCKTLEDVYCRADPAALTWGDASEDFKSGKATKIHVKAEHLSVYESKFGSTVRATFVGDLPVVFTVTFNVNGGTCAEASRTVTDGDAVGKLPDASRSGYTFVGWFTAESGGTQVTAATVVTGDVTYYAQWTSSGGGSGGGEGGGSGGGEGGGSGGSGGGETPVTPDGPCYALLNASDITAPYAAPAAKKVYGAVYDGCDVAGIVELKLGKVNAKKKTSKVSGTVTTLDGKKHKITAFNLTGIDGSTPQAVSLDVKDFGTMSITIGGEQFTGSLDRYHVQSAVVGGDWSKGGTKVYVDVARASLPAGTLEDLLPDGVPVAASGGKWKFVKAASVKWSKPKKGAALPEKYDAESGKGLVVDTSGDKTNLSGMKLTYTPKKGTFKGSFKVYALEGAGKATKLKKYTVKVNGVVVDGVGHGTATCKSPAMNWPVTVK